MKKLPAQIIKFAVVGGIAFVIDYGLMLALTELAGINYLVSNAFSFCASVIFNYLLSTAWVFKTEGKRRKRSGEFVVFLILSTIGLGLNELLMWLQTDIISIDYRAAKIIATAVVMIYNFITRKIFLEKRGIGENKKVDALQDKTQTIFRRAGALILMLVMLVSAYTVMLLVSSAMPNKWVRENVENAQKIILNEGEYPKLYFKSGSSADNFTDYRMVNALLTDETQSLFVNTAKVCAGTPFMRLQYWQGYIFFLKPLFVVFNLYQVRYILYLVFFVMLGTSLALTYKKAGGITAISFAVGLVAANVLVVPASMQYVGVYYILFATIIILLSKKEYFLKNPQAAAMLFLIVGSYTCFIDFLTAPLITLGIPLCIYIIICNTTAGSGISPRANIFCGIKLSALWGIGYFFTFAAKWVIASLLLGENVISRCLSIGMGRVNGEETTKLNRLVMLAKNIRNIMGFGSFSVQEMIAFSIIMIIAVLLLYDFFHKPFHFYFIELLAIAFYPICWYLVLANHSQIHSWMTYRSLMITAFAISWVVFSSIDFKRLKETLISSCKKLKRRNQT